ncbi:MAG: carbohydrate ABC transporter permease [Clostridiales bacterium]|nr:carbohydrate ABC transporter permease [Clostridiales bacterium]
MTKSNIGEKVFDAFNFIFMILVILITIYPFYYVICASFSGTAELLTHRGLLFVPLNPTLGAYKMTFSYPMVPSGYKNTLFVLVFGVPINMILTIICAYVMASKDVLYKDFILAFIMFTMFFNGGMIPNFLNIRSLGLYNSLWALILPGAISVYNSIIVKTAIEGIPDSLSEAAYIDGAHQITILFRIIIPLIIPTLAVITLYYSVGHWNAWFNALLYLKDNKKLPIQAIIRAILIENDMNVTTKDVTHDGRLDRFAETIKYAIIVIGTVPILISYPFLQRYFVEGVMIGAVKG